MNFKEGFTKKSSERNSGALSGSSRGIFFGVYLTLPETNTLHMKIGYPKRKGILWVFPKMVVPPKDLKLVIFSSGLLGKPTILGFTPIFQPSTFRCGVRLVSGRLHPYGKIDQIPGPASPTFPSPEPWLFHPKHLWQPGFYDKNSTRQIGRVFQKWKLISKMFGEPWSPWLTQKKNWKHPGTFWA